MRRGRGCTCVLHTVIVTQLTTRPREDEAGGRTRFSKNGKMHSRRNENKLLTVRHNVWGHDLKSILFVVIGFPYIKKLQSSFRQPTSPSRQNE